MAYVEPMASVGGGAGIQSGVRLQAFLRPKFSEPSLPLHYPAVGSLAQRKTLSARFEADRLAIISASDRDHYAVNIFKNLQGMGFEPTRIVPINRRTPRKFLE